MSEENVDLARQSAEAIDRRDPTAWLALHNEDLEVVASDDWPEEGARGAVAAWDFYKTIFDALERLTGSSGIGEVEVVDAGADTVLVHNRTVDLSGGEISAGVRNDLWIVVTIGRGKILREHWFTDRGEALEAAGLLE